MVLKFDPTREARNLAAKFLHAEPPKSVNPCKHACDNGLPYIKNTCDYYNGTKKGDCCCLPT